MKKKFNYDDLFDLIVKKACGFSYVEEQYEYEKTQNSAKISEKIVKNDSLDKNLLNSKKFDTVVNDNASGCDIVKTEDKKSLKSDGLCLVKKKVSTHYELPDMVAIKILLEIFSKREGEAIDELSDDDLMSLKNKLVEELQKNESVQN